MNEVASTALKPPVLETVSAFAPPLWLRNAHIQSILPSLRLRKPFVARRAARLLAASRELLLDCGDDVWLLGLHSAQAAFDGPASRDLVVLIHGWEGSADSLYLLSLGGCLFERGFDVVRLNLRDHGPTHHLNVDLFHSCRIAEVVGAVARLQSMFPEQRLHIGGFSLGGNFALRVATRAPQRGISLASAFGVCPVLRPHSTLAALESGWFAYRQYFMLKWRRSLRIKERCFPDRYDFSRLLEIDTITAMTDFMVRHYSEFPDLDTYLSGYAIVGDALAGLSVPSHILFALDDPIIPARDLPDLAQPPCLSLTTTSLGGHCGFIDRPVRESWVDRRVLRWLEQHGAA